MLSIYAHTRELTTEKKGYILFFPLLIVFWPSVSFLHFVISHFVVNLLWSLLHSTVGFLFSSSSVSSMHATQHTNHSCPAEEYWLIFSFFFFFLCSLTHLQMAFRKWPIYTSPSTQGIPIFIYGSLNSPIIRFKLNLLFAFHFECVMCVFSLHIDQVEKKRVRFSVERILIFFFFFVLLLLLFDEMKNSLREPPWNLPRLNIYVCIPSLHDETVRSHN